MAVHRPSSALSFAEAVAEAEAIRFRSDLVVHDIPAPSGLAPDAFALAADVRPSDDEGESAYGTGRLVLLHDPASPEAWDGPWRIVCFAQAPLEPEIGTDPLVAEVAWSWLTDALDARGAGYRALSGTATKTLSQGFGGLADEGSGAQIELRASWSPTSGTTAHIEAWAELVCMLAGLPPGSENAPLLRSRGASA